MVRRALAIGSSGGFEDWHLRVKPAISASCASICVRSARFSAATPSLSCHVSRVFSNALLRRICAVSLGILGRTVAFVGGGGDFFLAVESLDADLRASSATALGLTRGRAARGRRRVHRRDAPQVRREAAAGPPRARGLTARRGRGRRNLRTGASVLLRTRFHRGGHLDVVVVGNFEVIVIVRRVDRVARHGSVRSRRASREVRRPRRTCPRRFQNQGPTMNCPVKEGTLARKTHSQPLPRAHGRPGVDPAPVPGRRRRRRPAPPPVQATAPTRPAQMEGRRGRSAGGGGARGDAPRTSSRLGRTCGETPRTGPRPRRGTRARRCARN